MADTLSELINLLTTADKVQFRQYLERKNKRTDVKNLQLLNLVETDDIKSISKLYKSRNKDAYHALRKRLQDNLLLFLSQKTFESHQSDAYEALRLVVAGRFLLENSVAKTGFKCLDKAERLAGELEQFNLLNELLLLKLQYAHLPEAEDFEVLTARFLKNQADMQLEARLNMAYAFLRQELQQIHQRGKIVNLTFLMLTTIRKYKISVRELMTYKSVYQILLIANAYAAIQHNYSLIRRFVDLTSQFINARASQKKGHVFYHISILYFLSNYHLRCREFAKSKILLDEMMALMRLDSRYQNVFYLPHQLLSALNLFFTGSAERAIADLQASLAGSKQAFKTEDVEDIRICLAMCLALCNNRESLKHLTLLTQTDTWYERKMGMLWTIRKNLMEILVHAQFSNIELAISRLASFRRRYRKYLLQTSEQRVLDFLRLVEQSFRKPDCVFETGYQKKVLRLLDGSENQDLFILSFVAWLMARWRKKTAYEIILEFTDSEHPRTPTLLPN